jgi:F-type H+-transporting ATPase subunit b
VINLNFTLLIQLVNFLILLLLLNALLYKPIMAKIREREAAIKKDREKALELETEVANQEGKHRDALIQARKSAADEKASLLAASKVKESEILEKARLEAARIVEEMRKSIQAESDQARKKLKEDMTPLAQSVTEKILGRAV